MVSNKPRIAAMSSNASSASTTGLIRHNSNNQPLECDCGAVALLLAMIGGILTVIGSVMTVVHFTYDRHNNIITLAEYNGLHAEIIGPAMIAVGSVNITVCVAMVTICGVCRRPRRRVNTGVHYQGRAEVFRPSQVTLISYEDTAV